jgi:hypothetical protein
MLLTERTSSRDSAGLPRLDILLTVLEGLAVEELLILLAGLLVEDLLPVDLLLILLEVPVDNALVLVVLEALVEENALGLADDLLWK